MRKIYNNSFVPTQSRDARAEGQRVRKLHKLTEGGWSFDPGVERNELRLSAVFRGNAFMLECLPVFLLHENNARYL